MHPVVEYEPGFPGLPEGFQCESLKVTEIAPYVVVGDDIPRKVRLRVKQSLYRFLSA